MFDKYKIYWGYTDLEKVCISQNATNSTSLLKRKKKKENGIFWLFRLFSLQIIVADNALQA